MFRKPVISSRIKSVGWTNNVLEVEFHDGKIYEYYDVSWHEYIDFINSPSLGKELSNLDKKHNYSPIK